jgi:AbrB family looped-hinge helix DNA binding protein
MITAKVSAKGQVTLPAKIRKALNVRPGERVIFLVRDERVEVQAIGPSTVRALAGALKRYGGARESSRAIRDRLRKEIARAAAQEG